MGATSNLEFCWICFLLFDSIQLWKVKKKRHFPLSRFALPETIRASPLKKKYIRMTELHSTTVLMITSKRFMVFSAPCSCLHIWSMESHLRIQGAASKILDLSPTWAHQSGISKAESAGSAPFGGILNGHRKPTCRKSQPQRDKNMMPVLTPERRKKHDSTIDYLIIYVVRHKVISWGGRSYICHSSKCLLTPDCQDCLFGRVSLVQKKDYNNVDPGLMNPMVV